MNPNITQTSYTVKTIRLSTFISTVTSAIQIPLVKMDIEGSEYSVLKDLASNRLLCKKHIDTLLVELHGTPFNFNVSEFRATMGRIRDEVNSQNCAVTEILPFWDESYLHDVR